MKLTIAFQPLTFVLTLYAWYNNVTYQTITNNKKTVEKNRNIACVELKPARPVGLIKVLCISKKPPPIFIKGAIIKGNLENTTVPQTSTSLNVFPFTNNPAIENTNIRLNRLAS